MSCKDCEAEQAFIEKAAYLRIGSGNVMIVGCKKHVKQLIDGYNKGSR